MALKAQQYKSTLNFRFDAGTSRGVLKNKISFFIKLFDDQNPECFGLGEASPLMGLSSDFFTVEKKLQEIIELINNEVITIQNFHHSLKNLNEYSSVYFALESAFLDLKNGGIRKVFDNDFYGDNKQIEINGLIWMGDVAFMQQQIKDKIKKGFKTIKIKIGAIDFDKELYILKSIRKEFSAEEITLRVDANGAFEYENVFEKLIALSKFEIHSIEQPIKAGKIEEMAKLCEISPVPIGLDEELLGNDDIKTQLLSTIKPHFIILKPSLMGGFGGSKLWIEAADELGIKWWITSALESNIGLNAICQFTAEFDNKLPQGLGTGQLYKNNFESPLTISNGNINYDSNKKWDFKSFF